MIPNWKKGIGKIRNKHIRGRPWFGAKVRKSRFILDTTSMYKKESKRRSTETAQVDMQRFDVAEEDVRDRL